MKLGEFIGLESRSVEFKELRLSCGISFELYLSTEELSQLLDNGIWTPVMNQAIYQKIVRDSREYFPKYISAFLNTKELGFQGRLHYGVNDLGTLVGIPILGELNQSKIRRLFTKSLSKIHCFDSKTHDPSLALVKDGVTLVEGRVIFCEVIGIRGCNALDC